MTDAARQERIVQDQAADAYEDIRYQRPYSLRWYTYLFRKIHTLLEVSGTDRVLDNGCGIGKFEEITGSGSWFGGITMHQTRSIA